MPDDTPFGGFNSRDKLIPVPETFFAQVLPHIQDVAALKVALWAMWAIQQRSGEYRYLSRTDFAQDAALIDSLNRLNDAPAAETLDNALAALVDLGMLLKTVFSHGDNPPETLYFIHSERGAAAKAAIEQGQYVPQPNQQMTILPPRPNIYRLYEQEIGPLTPMIAEGLQDLENDYPPAWLPDAIRVAAEAQAKNLRYIRAVLEGWRKEGKQDDQITRGHESQQYDGSERRVFGGSDAAWIEQ